MAEGFRDGEGGGDQVAGRGLHLGTPVSVVFGPPILPAVYDDPVAGKERYQVASNRIMAHIAALRAPPILVI